MESPNAKVLALVGVGMLLTGYFLYSKFLDQKVYQLNDSFVTAAHRFEDGVDYVPTNRFVLWGHHFTSVAGVAPIAGPAIARAAAEPQRHRADHRPVGLHRGGGRNEPGPP